MSQELWKASSDSWERAQTALGSALNPYLDNLAKGSAVLGESTAELLEAYPRTTAGLTAAAGAVLSGYLAYREGAALSTCCVAVGSVGEERCRRRSDRTGRKPGIGW